MYLLLSVACNFCY